MLSRSLTKAEKNYSTFKLEFLALKWAIMEKFHDYLSSSTFVVITDNNPLTYILSSAKLEATGQRWVSQLNDFNFSVTCRPGSKHTDADVMSRYLHTEAGDNQISIDCEAITAICNGLLPSAPVAELLPCCSVNILDFTEDPSQVMAKVELRELRVNLMILL